MSAAARLTLWCLKNARRPIDLVQGLAEWVRIIREVRRAPNGPAALAFVWRYIFHIGRQFRKEDLVALLEHAVGEEDKGELMSVADQFREEGDQRGRRGMPLRLLAARFGPVPDAMLSRVNAADSEQLDAWAERVLSASSLADVLGSP